MSSEEMIAKNFRFLYKDLYDEKQKVLAKEFGVSQNTISCYANGTRKIPTDILSKIADRYGVSPEALINKDLSFEYDSPQQINIEHMIKAGLRMFPIFTSELAKKDWSFNRAYEITKELFNIDEVNVLDGKICICELAIKLYKKAWLESKTYIALANSTSLILNIYARYNQDNIKSVQELIQREHFTDLELRRAYFLDSCKPKANKYENRRKTFFDKYYDLVYENIKLLKQNIKYSDLGDFYLAICYLTCFVDDIIIETYGDKICANTGMMMLIQQVEIDNDYAIKLIECYD